MYLAKKRCNMLEDLYLRVFCDGLSLWCSDSFSGLPVEMWDCTVMNKYRERLCNLCCLACEGYDECCGITVYGVLCGGVFCAQSMTLHIGRRRCRPIGHGRAEALFAACGLCHTNVSVALENAAL